MAQTARPFPALLNTDGKRHPLENGLAGATMTLGLVAFITAFWSELHLVSSWAGITGLLVGAWGQMISVTTAERFVLIVGLGAAGVGVLLGIAHGGPFGGLW